MWAIRTRGKGGINVVLIISNRVCSFSTKSILVFWLSKEKIMGLSACACQEKTPAKIIRSPDSVSVVVSPVTVWMGCLFGDFLGGYSTKLYYLKSVFSYGFSIYKGNVIGLLSVFEECAIGVRLVINDIMCQVQDVAKLEFFELINDDVY